MAQTIRKSEIDKRRFALSEADAARLQELLAATLVERVPTQSLVVYAQNVKRHPRKSCKTSAASAGERSSVDAPNANPEAGVAGSGQ